MATSSAHNEYVTAPLAEVLPFDQSFSEEELHLSFEEAISERSSAVHQQLARYSHPALLTQEVYTRDPMRLPQTTESHLVAHEPCRLPSKWQRFALLISLPLNLLLAGFDLMGLLVLHVR